MVIKLDLANTFDRIRNSYIFEVMQNYGFLEAFTQWVKACIRKPCISSLINGRPTSFFQAQRGSRKGFPMSHLLYILVTDCLSIRLFKLKNERKIPIIGIARGDQAINHSQFANGTILLGSDSTQIASHFRTTLDLFLKVYGSQINVNKSWMYSWNSSPNYPRELANILGVQVNLQWTSFIYLGVPTVNKKVPLQSGGI